LKGTIPVVFVVVLLAVGGAVALSSTYMRPAVVSPSSLAGLTSTGETNPQTALKFAMTINSSSARGGGVLGVSLSLFNTLVRDNNVTGDQNWKLTDASESGGVYGWNCAQNDVFRIEVVSGHYDISNFSIATPLDAFVWTLPLGPNQCGYYIRPANWTAPILTVPPNNQNYYVFRPTSDAALWVPASELASRYAPCVPSNGTYHCMQTTGQAAVMSETMVLKTGLFAGSPGIFTVVGGDEWGDLAVLHFYVGSGASQETSSTETCTPAITLTQTGANATTTRVITLCHKQSTYSVSTTMTSTTIISQCPTGAVPMTVNGSTYCASDVSKDIVVQQPGYSYFLNSSITFMGVKFETICPSNYGGCPGSNGNSTTVLAAAIQLSVTFSGGTKETVGGVIGDLTYFYVLSNHLGPKAGILIEYVSSTYSYKAFLLVSPSN
jgi:hypothetical protein